MLMFRPMRVSIPFSDMSGMANLIMMLAPLGATVVRLLFVLSVSVSLALVVVPMVLIMREFTWFPVLIMEIPTTVVFRRPCGCVRRVRCMPVACTRLKLCACAYNAPYPRTQRDVLMWR